MNIPTKRPTRRSGLPRTLLLVLGAFLAGVPSAQQLSAQSELGTPPPDPGSATLMPGDVLQVYVWREPDLGGDFPVNEDGEVTLPMLGSLRVAGIPLRELRDELLEAYRVELRNPSITIRPLRRVYVLGEVNRPGVQALDPTLSLAGAVAIAGGASPLGDLRNLSIVRGGYELTTPLGPEMDLLSVGVRSGDQIFVGRRSWLERNAPFVASTILGVAGIVVAIVR